MKSASVGLIAHLQQDVTTLCRLLRVVRTDSEELFFTDASDNVTFDGDEYRADISFLTSSIFTTSEKLSGQNVELQAFTSEDGFSEADVRSRRYRGATAEIYVCNWADPSIGAILLFTGKFGRIEISDKDRVSIELFPLSGTGRALTSEKYSPTCRNTYGDSRCTVDIDAAKVAFTVDTVVTARSAITASELTQANEFWTLGQVRWLTGDNAGLLSTVLRSTNATSRLDLVGSLPFDISVGDTAEVFRGCNKQPSRCRDEDDNLQNFRGEPHVPQNSVYVRGGGGFISSGSAGA